MRKTILTVIALSAGSPALAAEPYVGIDIGSGTVRASDVDETDTDLVEAILQEAAHYAAGVLDSLNRTGDVQGARWHDGEPITVEDVIASLREVVPAPILPMVERVHYFVTDASGDVAVGLDYQVQLTGATAANSGAAAFVQDRRTGEVLAVGTILDHAGEVELCLGPVAESYPPQCDGLPMADWTWEGVDGFETSGDVTWGAYAVRGTYDGAAFTTVGVAVSGALLVGTLFFVDAMEEMMSRIAWEISVACMRITPAR